MTIQRKSDAESAALVAAVRKLPDREMGRLLRRSWQFVRTRSRRAARRASATGAKAQGWIAWTVEEMILLGTDLDAVIARRMGRTRIAVSSMRRRLDIAVVPKKRPWTEKELRLLGTQSDEAVARLIGRSKRAVNSQRHILHIPNVVPAPPHRRWKLSEVRLLGKQPDAVVARRLNRTYESVAVKRGKLKIPARRRAGFLSWTKEDLELLGSMPDAEVAKRLRRSLKNVRGRRENLHLPVFDRQLHKWTDADDKLLGVLPDERIARRLGITVNAVKHRRTRLRVYLPRQLQKPRSRGRRWTQRELALLGKITNREVSQRLHCSLSQVKHRRRLLRKQLREAQSPRRTIP